MSRGRKAKTTKGAESKLVLGAEFFFTTLSFDLVLTAHVFCVALHQSFGIELFTLDKTLKPHKKLKQPLITK